MTPRRLFIYFRVEREREADVVAAVRALQATWQSELPGLRCELLRSAARSGAVTLMETYSHSLGVGVALQARIEREALSRIGAWLVGERHVEIFEPCA